MLAGDPAAGPVNVSLAWGPGAADRATIKVPRLAAAFSTTALSFVAPVSTADARLVIAAAASGTYRVGTASLMPADNIEGFRPDTLKLLRELDAPVYRWPGGNFVSGYNWHDGIGDRDTRPPRKNPAWKGVEHNDVGIHEFMAFCRLVNAEPYIAVNSGLGDATSAAERSGVRERRGDDADGEAARGQRTRRAVALPILVDRQRDVRQLAARPHAAEGLRPEAQRSSPTRCGRSRRDLELIGVGAVGEWSEAMLANCADNMTLISEHFYSQDKPGLMAHISQIPTEVRRIAEAHRRYRASIPALQGKDIRIALDEWNYWYGPHLYGELGTQYFLKDALGIAAGLHEYARQSDIIFMANYAQTVNVIGAIKTSKTDAVLDSTGMVLKMYRQHFGTIPVESAGAPEPLDVVAAWTEGRKALTIAIVNPTGAEQGVDLEIAGLAAPASARLWRIAGTDPMACNVPGKLPQVAIQETAAAPFGRRVTVPPMSASIYEIR